eukprot:5303146-Lingulodinium_polyedra.AAC.1
MPNHGQSPGRRELFRCFWAIYTIGLSTATARADQGVELTEAPEAVFVTGCERQQVLRRKHVAPASFAAA